MGVLARGGIPRCWMQYRNVKKKTLLKTHILQHWNVQQLCCESVHKLGLRVLVKVDLHGSNYFSLGIRVYEETVIDVIICQMIHDILNP
jgi:hypothetical protein